MNDVCVLISLERLLFLQLQSHLSVLIMNMKVQIIFRSVYVIESQSYYRHSLVERGKKRQSFDDWLAFCFFYVHCLNATDHLHENMQYSRDDDNNIDVKNHRLFFFFFFFIPAHTRIDVSIRH